MVTGPGLPFQVGGGLVNPYQGMGATRTVNNVPLAPAPLFGTTIDTVNFAQNNAINSGFIPASPQTRDLVRNISLMDPHMAADKFGMNSGTLFGLQALFS
jgi:hypothetical protein